MRTVNYSELPAEVGLSLGAALMGFTVSDFMTYADNLRIPIYSGENGYLVVPVSSFKHMHYTRYQMYRDQGYSLS